MDSFNGGSILWQKKNLKETGEMDRIRETLKLKDGFP